MKNKDKEPNALVTLFANVTNFMSLGMYTLLGISLFITYFLQN